MAMTTLSGPEEARILRTLEAAVKEIGADELVHPDEALAKAAAEEGLPAGHVNLLVRGYNTARTTYQRESGETLEEKAADFPVASAPGVMRRLFPGAREKAAAGPAPGIDPDYLAPPSWYAPAKAGPTLAEKIAGLGGPTREAAAASPSAEESARLEKAATARAFRDARALSRAVDESRLGMVAAQEAVLGLLKGARDELASPYSPSLRDVAENLALLHGGAGAAIAKLAAAQFPELAAAGPRIPDHLPREFPGLYGKFAAIADRAGALAAAVGRHRGVVKRAQEAVGELMAPFLPEEPPAAPSILDGPEIPVSPAPAPGAEEEEPDAGLLDLDLDPHKAAGWPGQVAMGLGIAEARDALHGMLKVPTGDSNAAVDRVLDKLSDPEHELALRNIRTRAGLNDMFLHDPIISSYHPREIASNFNELSQVAPQLATQPLLARAMLRKQLAMGQLDSFEGAEAVGLEQKLRDLHARQQPQAPRRAEEPRPASMKGGK